MGEVVPGVAAFAVVLSHRPPLPLAEVRTPLLPRNFRLTRVVQALLFRYVADYRAHAFPPLRVNELNSTQRTRTHFPEDSSCAIQATPVHRYAKCSTSCFLQDFKKTL